MTIPPNYTIPCQVGGPDSQPTAHSAYFSMTSWPCKLRPLALVVEDSPASHAGQDQVGVFCQGITVGRGEPPMGLVGSVEKKSVGSAPGEMPILVARYAAPRARAFIVMCIRIAGHRERLRW